MDPVSPLLHKSSAAYSSDTCMPSAGLVKIKRVRDWLRRRNPDNRLHTFFRCSSILCEFLLVSMCYWQCRQYSAFGSGACPANLPLAYSRLVAPTTSQTTIGINFIACSPSTIFSLMLRDYAREPVEGIESSRATKALTARGSAWLAAKDVQRNDGGCSR